ncbi:MAG: acyltransferase [Cytophagales bacterium]|nr:acyltransferase [Cytophagales bacterium]
MNPSAPPVGRAPVRHDPAPSPALPAAPLHLKYLDGLRALAALYVLVHHSFLQVYPGHRPVAGRFTAWGDLFFYGGYAVALFIVLSGFCLALPVVRGDGRLKHGVLGFLRGRALRILPPYFLAVAASLLLIWGCIGRETGTHWDVSIPVSGKSIVTHLLLIHDLVGDFASINHSFWSIAVEWRIYLLFPLLVVAWRAAGPLGSTALVLVASYLAFRGLLPFDHRAYHVHFAGLFTLGMLAATVAYSPAPFYARLRKAPWALLALAGLAGVVVASKVPLPNGELLQGYQRDYVVGIWATALLVYLATRPQSALHRLLSRQPLVWLGGFAYSIYLMHAPLIQVVWQYLLFPLHSDDTVTFRVLVLVGTPVIVANCYLFYVCCEKPFVRLKNKSALPGKAGAVRCLKA